MHVGVTPTTGAVGALMIAALLWPSSARTQFVPVSPVAVPREAPAAAAATPDYGQVGRALDEGAHDAAAGGSGLKVPPVRIWGDFGFELRREGYRFADTREIVDRTLTTLGLNAATYLVQPWLATLKGALRLSASRTVDGRLTGSDRFATGSLRLAVFPQSRFPFEAYVERLDSRLDSGVGSALTTRSTRFGARQRYRSEDGALAGSLSIDHYRQDSEGVGLDIQDIVQFDATLQPDSRHRIHSLATLSRARRGGSGETSRYDTVVLRHRLTPRRSLSVDSSLNLTRTADDFGASDSDTRFVQFTTLAYWRPVERPLTVSANLRVSELERRTLAADSDTAQATAGLGVVYTPVTNWRYTVGASTALLRREFEERRRSRSYAGVEFNADSRAFGDWSYDAFAGLTVDWVAGNAEDEGGSANLRAGQSLSRRWPFGSRGNVQWSANQSVSLIAGRALERGALLSHGTALAWTRGSANSNALVRLHASESRYLGDHEDVYQLANFQASLTLQEGRNDAWNGSLTWQATRNRRDESRIADPAFADSGWVQSTTADLSYRRDALFGLPRLRWFSRLRIQRQELLPFVGSFADRERASFETRLDYRIGRLETRLSARVAEIDDSERWVVMLRLIRNFGR